MPQFCISKSFKDAVETLIWLKNLKMAPAKDFHQIRSEDNETAAAAKIPQPSFHFTRSLDFVPQRNYQPSVCFYVSFKTYDSTDFA